MVALHMWSLAHGIAALFGRGDAARRKLPMTPEDLLRQDSWSTSRAAPAGPKRLTRLVVMVCECI